MLLHDSPAGPAGFVRLGDIGEDHVLPERLRVLAKGLGIGIMYQRNTKTDQLEAVITHDDQKKVGGFCHLAERLRSMYCGVEEDK